MEIIDTNFFTQYFTTDFWLPILLTFSNKLIAILFIIFFTWLILKARHMLIHRIFLVSQLEEKQTKTLQSLLLSITRYVIFIIAVLMGLSHFGLDIGPIIAGAGVIGLAVGFGAQTLVKDFITGFFIIFEDQFSVGDYVTINNGQINGTVVDVGLRATKIRTWAQHVVVIQNSEIHISQNYNRERMRAIVYITVPYEIDPSYIEQSVNAVSTKLVKEMPQLFILDDKGQPVEPPQLYGITDVENDALGAKYAVTSLVKDEHYWTACKETRKELLRQLRLMGIEVSYPRRIERQEHDLKIAEV